MHDHHRHGGGQPEGHERDEGLPLAAAAGETVSRTGGRCPAHASERRYDIVAMAVDITLNRYGDHDPRGRLYALAEQVDAVRRDEARGAAAVSLGLQGDTIQPLVLRVLPGECLRVELRNDLPDEPASFHLHESALVVATTGTAATAANPDALALPRATVHYEWHVPEDEPEGTRVFHSHGDARRQSGHGLFGTLVVEPPGSRWLDPRTGEAGTTGWDAVVETPGGTFREFVLAYHEVGDEDYRVARAGTGLVPQVDPITKAYRPAARAINYRSEPFLNRLQLQVERSEQPDESLAYSSYAFGDPATPILRSYLGDPVKQRVVHGGSEVFHVHHVHGGSVRWRQQPGAVGGPREPGLSKRPPLLPGNSERVDSQSLGPSEAFDVDHECDSGGCQQGAGDYLVHCHIAHHYFAGMWGIWRVYNTLQDGTASTDVLPPLPALPDRTAGVEPAVTSSELAGPQRDRAVRHLPAPGAGQAYDASVWDWSEQDGVLVGEPEDTERWPGYASPTPGVRPPILFERATGRPAYPMLRPHLGARPPFAPGHGPAPYLDLPDDGEPRPPGADGPGSLCPAGTRVVRLSVRAVQLPVPLNGPRRLTDPKGMLFVLTEDEAALRADPARRWPLVVRANAGEDCVDVVLSSAVPDSADNPFSKVSAHIHLVQFDVQAGDGVTTGFNYEQTIRPFSAGGTLVAAAAPAGASRVSVADPTAVVPGALAAIGIAGNDGGELRRVRSVEGHELVLDRPLGRDHPAGSYVSTEFVRHRWYPDVQVGTAYFHDHVNGLQTWQRGLVGALIVEPPGSTYHDPATGEELRSGPIADVRAPAGARLSVDVTGSFRELVSFVQDGSHLSSVGRSPGSNLNLRAEPLDRRPGPRHRAFSSALHGDPVTPMLEAHVGDPVVFRTTVSGTNEVHTWHLDGHWFRRDPWNRHAAPTSTVHLGISERFDLVVAAAGGPQRRPGDYLYANGRALKLREGAWGLVRVHPVAGPSGLLPLPGREGPPGATAPLCPDDAPERRFDIAAVEARLPMRGAERARMFVVSDPVEIAVAEVAPAAPLVLRAAVGDCLHITLENRLPPGSPPVSLHADGLAYDPADSGLEAGRNLGRIVEAGDRQTFTFHAHPEYGEVTALLRDGADLAGSGALGLYGAVAVGPPGAVASPEVGWNAVVTAPGRPAWRDVVLFSHDEDDAIGTHRMPYTTQVRGTVGLNYGRGESGPVIETHAGDPLRITVLAPWSEQVQVFSVEGHRWPVDPAMPGGRRVDSAALGGLGSLVIVPDGGAGGEARLPGRYWLGSHREPYREAGLAGTLLVHDACGADVPGLQRIAGDGCPSGRRTPPAGVLGALVLVAIGLVIGRRRRSSVN